MNREERLQTMVENYSQKAGFSDDILLMEFHRKHLLLFLGRFRQLLSHFECPSSSLLSHDIFLIVEAATIVAKSDWARCEDPDARHCIAFPKYFKSFEELAKGIDSLDNATNACMEALDV